MTCQVKVEGNPCGRLATKASPLSHQKDLIRHCLRCEELYGEEMKPYGLIGCECSVTGVQCHGRATQTYSLPYVEGPLLICKRCSERKEIIERTEYPYGLFNVVQEYAKLKHKTCNQKGCSNMPFREHVGTCEIHTDKELLQELLKQAPLCHIAKCREQQRNKAGVIFREEPNLDIYRLCTDCNKKKHHNPRDIIQGSCEYFDLRHERRCSNQIYQHVTYALNPDMLIDAPSVRVDILLCDECIYQSDILDKSHMPYWLQGLLFCNKKSHVGDTCNMVLVKDRCCFHDCPDYPAYSPRTNIPDEPSDEALSEEFSQLNCKKKSCSRPTITGHDGIQSLFCRKHNNMRLLKQALQQRKEAESTTVKASKSTLRLLQHLRKIVKGDHFDKACLKMVERNPSHIQVLEQHWETEQDALNRARVENDPLLKAIYMFALLLPEVSEEDQKLALQVTVLIERRLNTMSELPSAKKLRRMIIQIMGGLYGF